MIKKYILSGILGGALLMGATSCGEDFLDRKPLDTRMEDNFYQTESDAMEALVAVYDVLQWQAVGPGPFNPVLMTLDIASGDTKKGGSGPADLAYFQEFSDQNVTAENPVLVGWWEKYYSGIYRANLLLERIEGVSADSDFMERTKAEAKFLRAYYYFDLVRLFGNIPLILEPLDPEEYVQEQVNPQAIYNQIATDLLEAIKALPSTVVGEEIGRVTSHAAKALLAKAYLHHNADLVSANDGTVNKAKALAFLEEVIASGQFDLVPNFADIWTLAGENNIESVFEIQFSEHSTWGDWGYLRGTDGNMSVAMQGIRGYTGEDEEGYYSGWSFSVPKPELVAEYDNIDQRKVATFINVEEELEPETYATDYPDYTGFYTRKYSANGEHFGSEGDQNQNFKNNIRAIRFADVLLMAAELGSPQANEYFNRVRRRAGLNEIDASLENIKQERRLEFALEGLRYFDLVRWGEYAGPKYFKIPQREMDLSGGAFVQN
ncbi:RagB/SusD family nutrient uptake outer membrane protein [Xanthovirga aplysinae]|uniref:RagB/SusD family nutrient uptake outer membrane protein n=1 Tax=Xanthovirga aplysinae TaxID=2529853 RepID=UPI0012BB61F5|nr:RagB/SusD family nutrient uptake outer membrane protein [Xanthovirga aplysinae]MTI33182.1 RagB/SusD family nutrient uptake outer membrane protein [Xanthovirga aplysinae]